jgi:hypothetical protein
MAKKPKPTVRDLIVEIRRCSEHAHSAAEELQNLLEEMPESDESKAAYSEGEELFNLCEGFNTEFSEWFDGGDLGKKVTAIEDAEDAAETPLAVSLRRNYFKKNPTKEVLPSQIAALDKRLVKAYLEKKRPKKKAAKKK